MSEKHKYLFWQNCINLFLIFKMCFCKHYPFTTTPCCLWIRWYNTWKKLWIKNSYLDRFITLTLEFLFHWLSFCWAHLCHLLRVWRKINVIFPPWSTLDTVCSQMQKQTHGNTDVTHSWAAAGGLPALWSSGVSDPTVPPSGQTA